jgi:hypothetical protein
MMTLIYLVSACTLLYIVHDIFFFNYPYFHIILRFVYESDSEPKRIKLKRCLFLETSNLHLNGNYFTLIVQYLSLIIYYLAEPQTMDVDENNDYDSSK